MRPSKKTVKRFALFDYGFRPFFLLAGAYAVIAIIAWLWIYVSRTSTIGPIPAQWWHAHEMLFGFVAATIAGFMLTAVPSWTASRGFAGMPLILLAMLWMLGRLAFSAAGQIPVAALVVAELAFLPALILVIAPALLRKFNRNTPLLVVLAALWLLDAAFLWGMLREDFLLGRQSLLGALDVVLLLITVIGGRIVPAFTANALKLRGGKPNLRTWRSVERVVIASMILLAGTTLVRAPSALISVIAAIAAGAHLIRIGGWQTHHTFKDPIVWVLHAAYLWLPVGLALRALHLFGGYSYAAHWLHALGIGAAATMIMAVMTRAALGHTGRSLRAPRPVAWAYGMLLLCATVRVLGPAFLPWGYTTQIVIAMTLWIGAFLLFTIVYAPILIQPRVDGKPG